MNDSLPLPEARNPSRRRPLPSWAAGLFRSALAMVLSGALAVGAVGGARAAVAGDPLAAPIHAFGWPADGAPNDPYYGIQTDLPSLGLAAAWARTTGDRSVIVAVLDTGIDAANAEFSGRIVPGFNALTGAEDGPGGFLATADDAGHGTHVAGTIAAAGNNGAGIVGIAPGVSIMPVKVLDADGEGNFGGMLDGMDWAIGHGARVISMSLGGTLSPNAVSSLQGAFDAAHAAGAVVIAASGNDGTASDQYPCNFIHVICVGSTTNDGSTVSTFSTRTSGLTLVAPGEGIVSTLPGNDYGYGSGTSMATPHVTGAVALLRSLNPTLTPDALRTSLITSARPLGGIGHNVDSGYGLLQVGAAISTVADGSEPGTAPTAALPSPDASPTPGAPVAPAPASDPAASPTPDSTIGPAPSPQPIVPVVTSASPRNGTRSVARSVRPKVSFSVPMTSVSTRTIRMKDLSRGRWVRIRVSFSSTGRLATIIPQARLAANHSYRVTVGAVLTATGGTPLNRPFVFTFRTGYR